MPNGDPMRAQRVEWEPISGRRRLGYVIVAVVSLFIFATIAWLDLQGRRTGFLDMTIMGATLAGGAFAAFVAIKGKEQRKVPPR